MQTRCYVKLCAQNACAKKKKSAKAQQNIRSSCILTAKLNMISNVADTDEHAKRRKINTRKLVKMIQMKMVKTINLLLMRVFL